MNRKRVKRVMRIFGIRPYRRRGRKFRKTKDTGASFPNLLLTEFPRYPHHIWASDFTHISFHGRIVYTATIIDLCTREVVGFSVMTTHSVTLVVNALLAAIHKHSHPAIIHSDHGSEYTSKEYVSLNDQLGIAMSMSKKASPWENGYQESFYSQFKVDLGDPNRFQNLGELVYAIYRTVHSYNNRRIHTALKMPPAIFAERHQRSNELIGAVS
jgi:putative transposase